MYFTRLVTLILLASARGRAPAPVASRRLAMRQIGAGAVATFAGVTAASAKEYPKMSAEEAQARYGAPSAATTAALKKLKSEGKSAPKKQAARGPGGSYAF